MEFLKNNYHLTVKYLDCLAFNFFSFIVANFLLKSAEYDIKLDIIEMVTISDGPALIVYIRITSNQEDLLCP